MTVEMSATQDDKVLLADGFEDCFVGIASLFTHVGIRRVAVYDYDKMVRNLRYREGMARDEAEEYLAFNTLGAYVGPNTPVYMRKMTLDQAREMVAEEDGECACVGCSEGNACNS